jgi:hypothetical protein
MADKKEVKPAEKKLGDVLDKHPTVQNNARDLFRNQNGTTIVQERVPRGDLPQDEVIMPRNEFDLTEDDLKGLAEHAKKMIDPVLAKYDEDVALEDALSKAVWSKDGSKYQSRLSACTQKLVLDIMKGGKGSSKKASVRRTMREVAEELEKKGLIKEYDYALPQHWVDEFAGKLKKDNKENGYDIVIGSFIWAYDKTGSTGYPFPVTDEAETLLEKYYPNYYRAVQDAKKNAVSTPKAASIDSLVDAIPTSMADIEKANAPKKGNKPPKEAGMDKEMLRKEANDLAKKLDALKVLLGEEDEKEEAAVEDKDAGSKKGPGIPDATGPRAGTDKCPKSDKPEEASACGEVADSSVLASLDEIAELVEKEAREKQDLDLFRIAYQIDCVSDYLGGSKDASTLQQDPDEDFMRKAFHSGVNEHDADEPYMKEFNNDNTKETSRVVGNISVQHKNASTLPYSVKKDA